MSRRQYGLLIILLLFLTAAIAFIMQKARKKNGIFIFTLLTAFLLRLFYILYTPTWERQHDVVGFGNAKGIGQAALIEWLYQNRRLPDFDPRSRWGFFQPLLHHFLAALWLGFNQLLHFSYTQSCENIQFLTLCYSICFTIYAIRIFKEMGLSGGGLTLATAITALHPSFILMSGSVNNDMLTHTLSAMAIFYGLRWYRNEGIGNIIKCALSIGLAMMAKLSGVLVAPAIAFLFLFKLVKGGREKLTHYIKEYAIFAFISLPLGLFFPLRNYFLFKVPLMYMPHVGEPVGQYSLFERIFDIRTDTPFTHLIANGNKYDEFNVPLALMKTSLLGEYDYSIKNGYMLPFCWILLISGTLLALLALLATVRYTFMGCRPDNAALRPAKGTVFIPDTALRAFWGIIYLAAMFFYLRLAFSVPNFSSSDFRYIAYLIVPEAMFLGFLYEELPKKGLKYILSALTGLFCLSSAGTYFLLGLP